MNHPSVRAFRLARLAAPLLAMSMVMQACDDKGTAPLGTSFALFATPNGLAISPGDSDAVRIDIVRSGGFEGQVKLTVTGSPTGVSASVKPGSTNDYGVLLVTTVASMPQGPITLTVTGTAAGQSPSSVRVTFTVGPPASLTLSALPVRLLQGGSGETTILATRSSGLTGQIVYSVAGVPPGLTASIASSVATGSVPILSLSTRSTVVPGISEVTVTGIVDGRVTGSVKVPVEIVPFSVATGNIAIDFSGCAAAAKPAWFVYQDGNGAWSQTLPTGDVYRFNVVTGKGGFAYSTSALPYALRVRFATTAELTTSEYAIACPVPASGKTVHGTIAANADDDALQVSLGGVMPDDWNYDGTRTTFTLFGVPAGPQPLVAFGRSVLNGNIWVDRLIIRRDLDIADNSSLALLDFLSAEAFAPAAAVVTIRGGNAPLETYMSYRTGSACAWSTLGSNRILSSTSPITGVPAARQRADDFHSLMVSENGETGFRQATESFHTLADRDITLPPAFQTVDVTWLNGSYRRLQAVLTLPPEYNVGVTFTYFANSVSTSRGWLGGAQATIAIPDFSGVTGFRRPPQTAGSVSWSLIANGRNEAAARGPCAEGARFVETSLRAVAF